MVSHLVHRFPKVEVRSFDVDSNEQTKLARFAGRDPFWDPKSLGSPLHLTVLCCKHPLRGVPSPTKNS